jgi:REP element-mobilizing transposase RayT
MPSHKHLRRLDRIWVAQPIYFITTCTHGRKPVLGNASAFAILKAEWEGARQRHGWAVGRYVVMPDHVHFFCRPEPDAKPVSAFVGAWKEWTAKRLCRELQVEVPVWQAAFFDHVLRSAESYSEKWAYVRDNPVRKGLVASAESWMWQGVAEELMF